MIMRILSVFLFFAAIFGIHQAFAQDDLMGIEEKASIEGEGINPEALPPLMFTPQEHVLLREAKFKFTTRPPGPGAVDTDPLTEEPIDPGIRELSLAGIVYHGRKDWTIWFNEQRVTPQAIPEEILDIKVYKSHIELKWYDEYTNQIFPVRLRPHQRFNLDTRIFLPG